jgi:hypothetical protein
MNRLLIFLIALAIVFGEVSSSLAQQPATVQERQIENTIPKHVPIDVKIRKEKEKAWKDLKNENWAHDFELEITNTGERPVYRFELVLFFDVPNEYGNELTTTMTYGYEKGGNSLDKARADDVPIKPGESKVFGIWPNTLLAWDQLSRKQNWRLPTKVRILFQDLNFGDGTGLMADKAVPYPKKVPQ